MQVYAAIWFISFRIYTDNYISSVFFFDQVESGGRKGSLVTDVPLFVSRRQTKWLNVVLDLNGILYECVGRASLSKGVTTYNVKDNIFSDECPTIVGAKAVYVRPGLWEFLAEISHIANCVLVWSSMLK